MTYSPPPSPRPILRLSFDTMRLEWQRTGVTIRQVLEMLEPLPQGLTREIVDGWMSNRIQNAIPSHWELVFQKFVELPDKALSPFVAAPLRSTKGRPKNMEGVKHIAITDEMHNQFMAEIMRTGADFVVDIAHADGAPFGLNERVIKILKYRNAKTIRNDYWEFIIKRLGQMETFVWSK